MHKRLALVQPEACLRGRSLAWSLHSKSSIEAKLGGLAPPERTRPLSFAPSPSWQAWLPPSEPSSRVSPHGFSPPQACAVPARAASKHQCCPGKPQRAKKLVSWVHSG